MRGVIPGRPFSLLLALLALALACSSPEQRKAEHLAKAEAYLEQREVREALLELRNALKLDPQSAEINARLARVLQDNGDLPSALFFWEEAHRLDPERAEYGLNVAQLLLFEDRERASALIEEVHQREPQNPLVHVRRSELALAAPDSAKALESALTAVEVGPTDGLARMHLGIVHRARIRELLVTNKPVPEDLYQEALRTFDEAIRLAGGDAMLESRGRIERAYVYSQWPGHGTEAAEAYRATFEHAQRPDLKQAALDAAAGHARGSRDREFLRWVLERQIELTPDRVETWVELARMVDPADAERSSVLERLIEERPKDADAQVAYVRDLVARQDLQAAVAHGTRVADGSDDPPVVWVELVYLQLASDLDAAQAIVERLEREHPDAPETYLGRGQIALATRRYDEAVNALQAGLQRRESVEAFQLLALAQRRLRQPGRALDAIQRAIELAPDPKPLAMLHTRGEIELDLRDWEAARRTYQEIRRIQRGIRPGDTLGMARALYGVNRPDAARVQLDQMLGAPNPPLEAILMFASMEGRRDPERAYKLLEEAAEREPTNRRLVEALAALAIRMGRTEEALERLDAAIASRASAPRLRVLRARLLAAQGNVDAAIEDARIAAENAPESRATVELLVALLASQGRIDEAIGELETSEREGRLALSGRLLLSRLHLSKGNDERAIELFEQALAERGDLPAVKNDLAYLLAQKGSKLDRALELAREARQGLPANAQAADTLGWVYLKKNLPGPAADQFREAIALTQDQGVTWATMQYHLGLALKALGQAPEASEAFDKALAAAVDFPEAEATRQELAALRGESG